MQRGDLDFNKWHKVENWSSPTQWQRETIDAVMIYVTSVVTFYRPETNFWESHEAKSMVAAIDLICPRVTLAQISKFKLFKNARI